MTAETMPDHPRLLLAGGGHSHALVLRMWAMRPRRRPRAQISLISRSGTTFYSGMVPGLVAGLYQPEAVEIDLRQLCAAAGVRFIAAEITGLDVAQQLLVLAGRQALPWDWLSLDVGSVSHPPTGERAVKPLEPFLHWATGLQAGEPVAIRGGGMAAVELALALAGRGLSCELLLRGQELKLGSAAANRLGEDLLERAGIDLRRGIVAAGSGPQAQLACTGSFAPAWLATAGLPCETGSGRVITGPSLQVKGQPRIFASGDCGLIRGGERPASGVWAVRAAPVLAANLERALRDQPLRRWRPQARALQLLGDGGALNGKPQAVALWGPWAVGPSDWLWTWKDRIDRRFMARLGEPAAAMAAMARQAPMACRGCGAKLAAAPLEAALQAQGLGGGAEDAAVIHRSPPAQGWSTGTGTGTEATGRAGRASELVLQSVDGFPALVDDPWLNGRLTALHACSDLWACGARVTNAQALVTLPEADAASQAELLSQTLAGIRSVLEPQGAALVGGHTLEGRDGAGLAVALSVNGQVAEDQHWGKGPLAAGQVLLISQCLGTGVLFAATMTAAARASWIDAALAQMQRSQAELVPLLQRHGCRACTDITGFGLLGHLGEMLKASGGELQVQLEPDAIPALAGALELLAQGHASSLAPANARALALLDTRVRPMNAIGAPLQQLLIDPQTCGPLLAALPVEQGEIALAAMRRAGFDHAALIGRIVAG
jgi:selenide,water dikinase